MSVTTYEEEASNIMAVKVCCDAPSVSHLLFVDDSLILIREDGTNATSLQKQHWMIILLHLDSW